jgi:hypothetical protein
MPLRSLSLPQEEPALPGDVRRLLREADRRIERFRRSHWVPGFVASDFARIYAGLRQLESANLARGRWFCEWGSGFGVVCCLAAMLGFESWGIEIDADLVEASRQLADDFGLPIEFSLGSFIPSAGDSSRTDGYEGIGMNIDDFDLIFVYPWPDEEIPTAALFHRHARRGALLLSYHGGDDVRLRRKVRRRPGSRS